MSSFVGVLGMLGLVLALLLVTLRLLKRFSPAASAGHEPIDLRVEQRVALGPRQGLAVVRIGTRLVAVSTGEGGVRRILELTNPTASIGTAPVVDESIDASLGLESATDLPQLSTGVMRTTKNTGFGGILRQAIRQSIPAALALMLLVPALQGAQAQGATATKAAPNATAGNAAATTTKPATPVTGANGQTKSNAPTAAAKAPVAQVAPVANAGAARADTMLTKLAPKIDLRVGGENAGGLRLSGTVGVVVMMGLLTLLPTLVLMMTGFTRILIVLSFLKQAIGTQTAPPAQLVAGLALLLTGFVMAPTLTEVNKTAIEPWMDGKIEQTTMLAEGVKPFRAFMLKQVRERDLNMFMDLSHNAPVATAADVPLVVLMSAFVTSELRTSFQIGFALFLPFIVIDIVVAAVLMSMGMMMVPPAMIALPFKLLLFVLVDGWALVISGLVQSFK